MWGKMSESVLGCGGGEGKCGEVCWGVGEVRRDVGVFENVGKGLGTCVGCGGRCGERCGLHDFSIST